jgi:hypothetical protein
MNMDSGKIMKTFFDVFNAAKSHAGQLRVFVLPLSPS